MVGCIENKCKGRNYDDNSRSATANVQLYIPDPQRVALNINEM